MSIWQYLVPYYAQHTAPCFGYCVTEGCNTDSPYWLKTTVFTNVACCAKIGSGRNTPSRRFPPSKKRLWRSSLDYGMNPVMRRISVEEYTFMRFRWLSETHNNVNANVLKTTASLHLNWKLVKGICFELKNNFPFFKLQAICWKYGIL